MNDKERFNPTRICLSARTKAARMQRIGCRVLHPLHGEPGGDVFHGRHPNQPLIANQPLIERVVLGHIDYMLRVSVADRVRVQQSRLGARPSAGLSSG